MAKIGRNQLCPCGSGKKHKHCCLLRKQAGVAVPSPMAELKVSLIGAIEKIQLAAIEKKARLQELGVFIFFSLENGDAWVLETTDSDAVQVAEAGKALEPPVDEDPEKIVIDWSHTFAIRDRTLFLTAYKDGTETEFTNAPTQQIHAAIRRILKQYSPELLSQVHMNRDADTPSV